ncbi:uncharacterized protein LOC133914255 isoform X2 [Phragmites australis]|uniref:uncharacterized protein LOC133914255 isoform X2 n=1 Tax=Phragmites australis TaxID=29695 RepID=UPI002D795129|nr:uncharacterized protein LOC133914255 isoform X2 [Phragmites australis]
MSLHCKSGSTTQYRIVLQWVCVHVSLLWTCRMGVKLYSRKRIGSSSRSSDSSSRSSTGTGIPTSGGELTTFIDSDVISHEQENFNILQCFF